MNGFMESTDLTTRERIYELLKRSEKPLTVDEIISLLNIPDLNPRNVYEHLEHIARSVKARSKGREYLAMDPPVCRKCGFVFKELRKPKKPTKCPRCRSEWISPPRFLIMVKD